MERHHYVDRLLAHYEMPRFHGPIPEADVIVRGENPGCGDIITIYLRVGEDDIAEKIHFEGEGCTISQGAASILLERVQGRPLAQIESIDYNDLIEELGQEVVMTRVRCATLSLSTLKNAIREYYARRQSSVTSTS